MSWEASASCNGADTDTFFPETGPEGYEQTKLALAICQECPVVTECWWEEITGGQESWGIRGGQKPSELNAARKAFEAGADQRPEIEAQQERAEKLAARQAKHREYSANYQRALRERAAAGDPDAQERLRAARERTNAANMARRAREKAEPRVPRQQDPSRVERHREAQRKYTANKRAREREERERQESERLAEEVSARQDVAEVA